MLARKSLLAMTFETILVVGEKSLRHALCGVLSRHGYATRETDDFDRALAMVREDAPDLVLLDVSQEGEKEWETCRAIRQLSSAPIIVFSAHRTQRDKVLAFDSGADEYVVKPFGMDELLARVRAAFRRSLPGNTTLPFVDEDLLIDWITAKLRFADAKFISAPKNSNF